MITPEQLREWANDADEGEDVALDGETLREIAEAIKLPDKRDAAHAVGYLNKNEAQAWANGWNNCLDYIKQLRIFI